MTLIKSISGIRGTVGGPTGDTLNPLDIVKFVTAYATFIERREKRGERREERGERRRIVVGRDARISGEMVKNVVCGTLMGCGYDVINIGLATTPTTELAVRMSGADGGIEALAQGLRLGGLAQDALAGEIDALAERRQHPVCRRTGRANLLVQIKCKLIHGCGTPLVLRCAIL